MTDSQFSPLPTMPDVSSPCSNSVPPAFLGKNDSVQLSTTPSTICDLDKENVGSQSEPRVFARRRKSVLAKRFCTSSDVLKELNSNHNVGASSLTSIFSLQNNVRSELNHVESPYGRFTRLSPSLQKYSTSVDPNMSQSATPTSIAQKPMQKRSIWLRNDESAQVETGFGEKMALNWSTRAENFKFSPIPDSKMSTSEDQSPSCLVFVVTYLSPSILPTFL